MQGLDPNVPIGDQLADDTTQLEGPEASNFNTGGIVRRGIMRKAPQKFSGRNHKGIFKNL